MPQIGGAQQQGEQLGVVSRGKGFVPQQQRQLVQKAHHNVPFPQGFVRFGQTSGGAQLACQRVERILCPQRLQKDKNLFGQLGSGSPACLGGKRLRQRHDDGAGGFGIRQDLLLLLGFAAVVARRAAGKGVAPILGGKAPCIGVVFQCAKHPLRQVDQPGFDKALHGAAAQPHTQDVQRGKYRRGGRGVFGCGGIVAEQRDILQPEFIPQRRQIPPGVAADDRHTVVGRTLPCAGGDLCRHGFGFGLAGGGGAVGDLRGRIGALRLGGVGRVGEQQVQLGQRGGVGVAQVVAQYLGVDRHGGVPRHTAQRCRNLFGTAEQPQPVVGVGFAVTAKADGHVCGGQHRRQQGALGRVEGVELVHIHRPPGKKFRLQALRRQLLAVGGVHHALPQKGLVRAVNQRQFVQFFLIHTRRGGVGCQRIRCDAGAFQLTDGLGCFFAEGGGPALAAVIHHLVQQAVHRAAHQQGAPGFVQCLHGGTAVTAQDRFRQRGKGVAFHIGGQAVPQRAVQKPLGGGGELFRHDQQAVFAALGAGAQLCQHTAGFAAAGGAKQ